MITIRRERPTDIVAREALLDLSFGQCRFDKTSERLRVGRRPADGLSFVAVEGGRQGGRQGGRIVGTVRLWHISTGAGRPALLLGPLAVSPDRRNRGIGASLIRRALRDARRFGHGAMMLVGDAPYYGRFGFAADKTGRLWLPGRYEPDRLLALELTPAALDGAHGLVAATGEPARNPQPDALVARFPRSNGMPRAA
jgi:predicted N-acetyltransferase YhbS